ncbi:MAG TPA: hypothetical protein VLL27_14940 [Solirubrobacterales bacterium]|nr:hypothetical protein [Solirubrobacterales bacterium]
MIVMAEESRTEKRLDELNAKVDQGFARVDQGFERVDRDIREVRGEIREVHSRFDSLHRTMILGFTGMTASIVSAILVVQL